MASPSPVVHDLGLETIGLVWLDASANNSVENIAIQKQFQSIPHPLKTFQNVQACEQYIRHKSNDDRIFFIASGQLGREIVPRIHQYRQIFSIYIYCQNKQLNEEWANKFPKVRAVIVKSDLLLKQIQSDYIKRIQSKVDEPFSFDLSPSNTSITADFLQAQTLLDGLLRMNTIPTDTSELITRCKTAYSHNAAESLKIQEFQQTYVSKQAIWWYTRDSFLNRSLNKALCTKNLDLLFLFGFLLRDIQENLQKNKCKSPIQVYHGQLLSLDELHAFENAIGGYISINTFFSANSNRKQILANLNDYSLVNDSGRILFEIDADPQIEKAFADITSFGYHSQEAQVLFSVGSIFRLMEVSHDKKHGIWVVKLVLSTIKKDYDPTDPISCGQILIQQLKKYDLAEKYFSRLLKELPTNHQDRSQCFHSLAHLSFLRNNYHSSLEWYQQLIKILQPSDPNLADTFYSIGCVYQKIPDYQQASQYYHKALQSWKNLDENEEPLRMAECLNNMGCINELEGNYSKALECHQKALSIRGRHQTDLGASYNNIGNVYLSLGEYDRALESYHYSIEMKRKSLSAPDPSLATTLRNMALAYEAEGNVEEALKFYQKAACIFEQLYPSEHVSNVAIQEDIQHALTLEKSDDFNSSF